MGLPIVRVTWSGVTYWPNQGYGRFAPAVRMDNTPQLEDKSRFDARRVRLADLDGTGTADLCYFTPTTLKIYRNQSGNSFDAGTDRFIPPHALITGQFLDFYGTGTSCFLYSLPTQAPLPLAKIWDPLLHQKPHLLTQIDNHTGRITRITYAASTKFSVADRIAGNPWATKLPFPVQVVEQVDQYDAIRRARTVSQYKYHQGHYDTIEREFRGFGYVEQTDTESFGKDHGQGQFPPFPPPTNDEIPQPPIVTKTWFHTGAFRERKAQEAAYQRAYWQGDPTPGAIDCVLPTNLPTEEIPQAYRALRGSMIRQEVFELDGKPEQTIPLAVTQKTYEVRRLQPAQPPKAGKGKNLPGVFHLVDRETRSFAYERDATDPRTTQTLALQIDPFGVVTQSATIAYPRRTSSAHAEQTALLCALAESTVLHLDTPAGRRLAIPIESRAYELTGLTAPVPAGTLLSIDTVRTAAATAAPIEYHQLPSAGLQKRLVQREIALYYNSAALPTVFTLGAADPRALLFESYLLDLTDALVTQAFGTRVTAPMLTTDAKYVTPAGQTGYWISSGHATFAPAQFYLPTSFTDAFDNTTTVAYDPHNFFATSVTDPLGNQVLAQHDYRVLSPLQVTDINGNRTQAQFDELGLITALAVMGKTGSSDGDTLADPTIQYSYEYDRWETLQKPNRVTSTAREVHGPTNTKFQITRAYFDGSGAVAMTKLQAEPATPGGPARWVGSGRTVLNNKGNPVKQYEPYFSTTFEYEDEDTIVATGVTPIITYDGLGRVKRTDLPNGTFSRTERTAWQETAYDPNDTIDEPGNLYKAARLPGAIPTPSTEEQRALTLTQAHANTPTVTHVDVMGRPFLVVAHNKLGATNQFLETRTTLDIESQPLEVKDPLLRTCQTNLHSMAGSLIKETNIDKGSRWTLRDAAGAMAHRWDDRSQHFRATYDALRRSTHLNVQVGAGTERLLQRRLYGDNAGITTPETNNLRGKLVRQFDGAGVARGHQFDFKGYALSTDRKIPVGYQAPEWSVLAAATTVAAADSAAASLLTGETFGETSAFDALNRVTSHTTPDSSQFLPTYNEAGLLETVQVKIRGAVTATTFVSNIDYNEKGQRKSVQYGNGTSTAYTYDALTFRLIRLVTTRVSPVASLQDLSYTFDPVGNIVQISDAAQQALFYDDAFVAPANLYTYDAIYRLTVATGREHKSNGDVQVDHNDQPIRNLPLPSDPSAVRNYQETFAYDEIGNITSLAHAAGVASWTRVYTYAAGSNRLLSTAAPGGPVSYVHDLHGNMTAMPHLALIEWDPFDMMSRANLGGGGNSYYQYDAGGARVRKVIDTGANLVKERIYLGGYEIYREIVSGAVQLERQTLHVLDGVKRLAMVETKTVDAGVVVGTSAPKQRYQLGNHLGSAMLELDETGLIVSYEEYHPYGSSAYRSARSGVEVSARRYRYVGMERDDETGLYLMGARYYACWLGRWTSADPMGIGADGPGLYNYTRGSPVTLSDPSGQWSLGAIAQKPDTPGSFFGNGKGSKAPTYYGTGEDAEFVRAESSEDPTQAAYNADQNRQTQLAQAKQKAEFENGAQSFSPPDVIDPIQYFILKDILPGLGPRVVTRQASGEGGASAVGPENPFAGVEGGAAWPDEVGALSPEEISTFQLLGSVIGAGAGSALLTAPRWAGFTAGVLGAATSPTPEGSAVAFASGLALSSRGGTAARERDPLLEFAKLNRTADSRFAAEYTSESGAKYYDVNIRGGRVNPFDHHGGCAEMGCLLQAEKAEGSLTGGSMRTVYNRPPGTPIPPGPPKGQGAPAEPCPACQQVLNERRIRWK